LKAATIEPSQTKMKMTKIKPTSYVRIYSSLCGQASVS
jgi:hypothetical protein